MARLGFPRRATPSKLAAASAVGGDDDRGGNGAATASSSSRASSSSSAPAPALPAPSPSPLPSAARFDREASPEVPRTARKARERSSSPKSKPNHSLTTRSGSASTGISASFTQLQAALARRQRARASAPASPPLSPEEFEKLWEEDHGVLLSAVEALVASRAEAGAEAGAEEEERGASTSPAAAVAFPATPAAERGGSRIGARPPSSGTTPSPQPPARSTRKGNSESGLTRPVALWLRKHEPLLREAAEASAEVRTFDTEAAILSLCAREGVTPEGLAEECALLSSPEGEGEDTGRGGAGGEHSGDPAPPLGVDVAAALDRAAELRRALANFDEDARGDAPGFVTAADEETMRVRYRHIKGTKEHTVRFEATLAAPLEHLLALCSEIDLSPGWNGFVVDAAVVARTAKFCSFYYASQWSPRPFPQMDSCVRVRGHDAYDTSAQGAVVCLESWPREVGGKGEGGEEEESDDGSGARNRPNEKPFSLNLPAAAAKRHRVLVLPGSCIVLAPIRPCPVTGAKRTRGTLLVTLDPRLPFVPSFLVAWVLRVLALKRGIDAVMASWFLEEGGAAADGASPPRRRSPAALKAAGGEMAAEMRRRLRSRPELYELAKRLVARHASERGGELPASPERRRPLPRTSNSVLRRSSSEAAAAADSSSSVLRRRYFSSKAGIPASVSAVVDVAIARLSRMSSGGGRAEGEAAAAVAATAATATREQPPPSSPEDQGWISWLARPLSATASYASSLLFVERETAAT